MLQFSIGDIIFQLIILIVLITFLILAIIGISSLLRRTRTNTIKDLEIQNKEILKQLSEIEEKIKDN